jgi:hypothetical protein
VAAFFIADVGNGLILSCSSEFESSVCSRESFRPSKEEEYSTALARALLEGRQPIELTPTRLLRLSKDLPHDWIEQRHTPATDLPDRTVYFHFLQSPEKS